MADRNEAIGPVEISQRRILEILCSKIDDNQVQIRLPKLQDAVRFDDGILARLHNLSNDSGGIAELANGGSQPERSTRSGRKEAGAVGAAWRGFFRDRVGMVVFDCAVAR